MKPMKWELVMSTRLPRIIAFLTITLIISAATTNRLAAQSIFESCETDSKLYCDQVTPGNGRLFACLYAFEDKLSESCDAATEDQSNMLDWFFESVRFVMDRCADDIQKHCPGVSFGRGRIFSCLVEKTSSLTDNCKTLIPEMRKRLN